MKPFTWDQDKNKELKQARNITFERIVELIEAGNALTVIRHPNQTRYKGQFLMVLQIDDYIWLVPYLSTKTERFLKTAFPSRKATRKFMRGKEDESKT